MRNKIAVAVVNTILKRFLIKGVGFDITQVKLQKLAFFCHAELLVRSSTGVANLAPLTSANPNDKFYAFTYGPVMRSLYDEYRTCGSRKLDSYAVFKVDPQILLIARDTPIRYAIDDVLALLAGKEEGELISMTHLAGTPWANTQRDEVISDDEITTYYSENRLSGMNELATIQHASH